MSGKRYAFVPMAEDEVGPAKVVSSNKKHKHHHGDDRDSSSRHRRDRSRSRSPRRESKHYSSRSKTHHRDRDRADDFENRWGDEEQPSQDGADDAVPDFQESAAKRVKVSHGSHDDPEPDDAELSEGAREEQEARRDREEAEAFAERLKARDEKKTQKKVTEDPLASQRRSLADDAKARDAALPDLRIHSRQQYLKKRETERLALLRKQVAEETAELKSGVRLSEREKAEFAKNRELLRLAEERLRVDDHRDGYYMPEDYITEKGKIDRKKKEDALYKRYVDRDEYGQE
ncbi:MAG: hypothetical protein OK454_09835, partial [Thaumarchaeota archaeon]|nr:hypothetical protein [Nitrososphaerota archaeon]